MLVSSIDYNDYVGRMGIGRIERGCLSVGQTVSVCNMRGDAVRNGKITALFQIEGLGKVNVDKASAGDIVCFSGIPDVNIGDTVCDVSSPEPLPFVHIFGKRFALCR